MSAEEDFLDLDAPLQQTEAPHVSDPGELAQVNNTGVTTALESTYDTFRKLIFCVDVSYSMQEAIPKSVADLTTVPKETVARKTLTDAIKDRFGKFPNADISLVTFAGDAELRQCFGLEELLQMAETMVFYGGGTDIYAGVKRCVNHCKKSPSPVHIHNIVLITDGLDFSAAYKIEEELLPVMKERNIVLDIILIASANVPDLKPLPASGDWLDEEDEEEEDDEPVEVEEEKQIVNERAKYQAERFRELQAVCVKANGTFQLVRNAAELETRFLAAANRLCLPAPVETSVAAAPTTKKGKKK